MIPTVYACYNLNDEIRLQSSSGGVYGALADKVLKRDGVVYGVCFDENFETIHCKIDNLDELPLTFGSKYVPSRLENIFREVKISIEEDKEVLFVGTPCQVAGLRAFLGCSSNKLILMDFVCHGVPSKVAWRNYLKYHKLAGNILKLNMRDKASGWTNYQYSWHFLTKDKKDILIPQSKVSYMKGFTHNLYLRPSCYECNFKGLKRMSDITLGDFWGVWNLHPEMDDNKGTSVLFINTDKGKECFEMIRNRIEYKAISPDDAIACNPSIVKSALLTEKRKVFYENVYKEENFDTLIDNLSRESFLHIIKRKGMNMLKKLGGG